MIKLKNKMIVYVSKSQVVVFNKFFILKGWDKTLRLPLGNKSISIGTSTLFINKLMMNDLTIPFAIY